MKVIHVNEPGRSGWEVANVQDFLSRIEDSLQKAKRARVYADMHLRTANSLIREAKEYIRLFKVEGFENFNWDPDAIVEGVREAARIKAEQEAAHRKAVQERERRAYRENVWPRLKAWLKGETDGDYLRTSRPLPRIYEDRVQTTWGASVPLAIAKRLYWLAVTCRRTHSEFVPPERLRVGDFTLTRIKPNGDLVIGCHDIPFWFMRYAACRNDIPNTAPEAPQTGLATA